MYGAVSALRSDGVSCSREACSWTTGRDNVKVLPPIDTAATVYARMISDFLPLFQESWPLIREGKNQRLQQDESLATFHKAKDLKTLNEIGLDQTYTARELINLLRARTFPPHPASYFVTEDGRKVYVRLQLEYAPDEG